MVKAIDWLAVKADYFTENLTPGEEGQFTLKALASRWKIAYKTVRNRASTEKWAKELRLKITEQRVSILQRVQDGMAETEAMVRQRQAQVARFLLDKALHRLMAIPPEQLTKREAIELVKIGLTEERKALGLADRQEVNRIMEINAPSSVTEQIARHQLGEALLTRILDAAESMDPPAKIAINCKKPDCN